jgi:hypothetical protein
MQLGAEEERPPLGRITLVEKIAFERIVPIEAEPPVIGLLMHEV